MQVMHINVNDSDLNINHSSLIESSLISNGKKDDHKSKPSLTLVKNALFGK